MAGVEVGWSSRGLEIRSLTSPNIFGLWALRLCSAGYRPQIAGVQPWLQHRN